MDRDIIHHTAVHVKVRGALAGHECPSAQNKEDERDDLLYHAIETLSSPVAITESESLLTCIFRQWPILFRNNRQ